MGALFEAQKSADDVKGRFDSTTGQTTITYYDGNGQPIDDLTVREAGNPFGLTPDQDISLTPSQAFQIGSAAADLGFIDAFTIVFDDGSTIALSQLVQVTVDDFIAAIIPSFDQQPAYQTIVGMLDDATIVEGSNASDGIEVGAGDDTVEGNAGDDIVQKWKSGDLVYDGGDGSDTLSFQAAIGPAYPTPLSQTLIVDLALGTGLNPYGGNLTLASVENIVGTSAGDRILGNDGPNVIGDGIADDGGDTIDGRGGDDTVLLAISPGAFSIDGGTGTDELVFTIEDNILGIGQVVLDLLNPALDTGPFADGSFANFERYTAATLIAVGGDVFVFGGSNGPDVVTGQNGGLLDEPSVPAEDVLSGRGGDDTMFGERGRDSLDGGAGSDRLDAGLDNDTLAGGAGNDTLIGGLGLDTAIFAGARAAYTISFDAPYTTVSGPDGVDLVTGMETLQFDDQAVDTPVLAYIEDASLVEGSTRFMGFTLGLTRQSAQNVTVTATTSNGTALAGSDYTAKSAPATIFGSEASGVFNVEIFSDTLVEGDETFTVTLSNPVNAALGSAPFATGTIIDDDEGNDTVPPAEPATDATVTGDGGANLLFGGALRDRIEGQGGADTAFGDAGDDYLLGGDGDDFLIADLPGAGNDVVLGGGGKDSVLGLGGDDSIDGGGADDLLVGDIGADTLIGGEATDQLFGGAGADSLVGGDGDDVLWGENYGSADAQPGNRQIGGAGNDRIGFHPGDVLAEGGEGILDVLVVLANPLNAPLQFTLGNGANQYGASQGPVPTVTGFEAVDAASMASPTGQGIQVTGAASSGFGNIVFASQFADTLAGSSAADLLFGNGGGDSIVAGAGNDSVLANGGNDTVTLGAGADFLLYLGTTGDGVVQVTDFVAADDRIGLAESIGYANGAAALAAAVQAGADVVIATGVAGRAITLVGVDKDGLTAADFEIVAGL